LSLRSINKAPRHDDVRVREGVTSPFLTSVLDGGEWTVSRPGRFTPEERTTGTHWIGGLFGRAGEEKIDLKMSERLGYNESSSGTYRSVGNSRPMSQLITRKTSLIRINWERTLVQISNSPNYRSATENVDHLCGLVVRVSGYRSRGPGFRSRKPN
jgi:hypothetical protein